MSYDDTSEIKQLDLLLSEYIYKEIGMLHGNYLLALWVFFRQTLLHISGSILLYLSCSCHV